MQTESDCCGFADVSRSLQMAALLRQPGWQQSQLRHKGLAARLGLKKTRPPASGMPPDAAPAAPKRKYKKNNSAASALSASEYFSSCSFPHYLRINQDEILIILYLVLQSCGRKRKHGKK
jgi:hypothetical protein